MNILCDIDDDVVINCCYLLCELFVCEGIVIIDLVMIVCDLVLLCVCVMFVECVFEYFC